MFNVTSLLISKLDWVAIESFSLGACKIRKGVVLASRLNNLVPI